MANDAIIYPALFLSFSNIWVILKSEEYADTR